MICENHDCGENVTMRYPVYRGRECRLLCYKCYLRWLKEEEDVLQEPGINKSQNKEF